MARLLYEIWEDREHGSLETGAVSEHSDRLRLKIAPNSVRLHSYYAGSVFEGFRLSNAWNGWGPWKPEPDWQDKAFTDAEAEEQARYIESRLTLKPKPKPTG